MKAGHLHPQTQYVRSLVKIFAEMGFEVVEAPEVDTEWYNFDALNVPSDHPSRDVQDTFWLKDGRVMRTHTSNSQVRAFENHEPPVRLVCPGVCYRNEATDEKHESTLTQFEGFYVDKKVTVGHLFYVLSHAIKKMYGSDIKYRFRVHHFPFVEPGFEMDVMGKRGSPRGEAAGWMEILGSGMIHPIVIKNMGLDPAQFSGFAFGMGPDRMVMQKYGIKDIRLLRSGDLRFLRQL